MDAIEDRETHCPRCQAVCKRNPDLEASVAERTVYHCDSCNWDFEV
jgi:hypothetical protein